MHTHMVFPVFIYRCETIKKAEHQRLDALKLWCWRRLSRIPWTARRSNQSILKEINPEYSLERLMLKLQHSSHLMWRTGEPGMPQSMGSQRARHDLATEQQPLTQSQPQIISITSSSLSFQVTPAKSPIQISLLCNEKGPVYFRSYYLKLQEHACIYQSRLSSLKGISLPWKTDFLQGGYGSI